DICRGRVGCNAHCEHVALLRKFHRRGVCDPTGVCDRRTVPVMHFHAKCFRAPRKRFANLAKPQDADPLAFRAYPERESLPASPSTFPYAPIARNDMAHYREHEGNAGVSDIVRQNARRGADMDVATT